jgi:hypothetical protein
MAFNKWDTVTPSDTADLLPLPEAVWVGGAGNLSTMQQDGTVSVLTAVAAGTLLPIQPKRIRATGTTATLLVAMRTV